MSSCPPPPQCRHNDVHVVTQDDFRGLLSELQAAGHVHAGQHVHLLSPQDVARGVSPRSLGQAGESRGLLQPSHLPQEPAGTVHTPHLPQDTRRYYPHPTPSSRTRRYCPHPTPSSRTRRYCPHPTPQEPAGTVRTLCRANHFICSLRYTFLKNPQVNVYILHCITVTSLAGHCTF